ncbi:hypothetical protein PMAYCL1PPCAC_06890, partial [Pristionchus mayeri]
DRIFRVGFVNENFPLLFTSHSGEQKGILNDIYTSFTRLNGFTLEWILLPDYGTQQWDGSYSGLLGDIREGIVDGSVERSYREDRIRNFATTESVLYQSDEYITRRDLVSKFSVSSLLVFSPFIIFLLSFAFASSFLVEQITHLIHLRLKSPSSSSSSFLSQLLTRNNPFVSIKKDSYILYRYVFSSILAGAYLRFIYNTAYTGSTVVSPSHERYLLDMVHDIRSFRSRLIIENPSFLSFEKTESLFGTPYLFPSNSVIPNEHAFIQHLCDNIDDYGKVNSFFLSTVDPQRKRREPCEISMVPTGNWQDSKLAIIRNSVDQAAPYTLLMKKKERSRKSLNFVILSLYNFEKLSTFHWRRYTNRNLFIPNTKSLFTFDVMKLSEISFVFYFLLIGYFISFVALSIEIGLMFANFISISKSLRLAKLT